MKRDDPLETRSPAARDDPSGHGRGHEHGRAARRSRLGPWILVATGLAASAALFAVMRAEPRDAMPLYVLDFEAGEDDGRDMPPNGAPALAPGDPVHLVARPLERLTGPFGARAFARCEGGPVPVRGVVATTASGTARLDGRVDELLGAARGDCELLLAVGRPGTLPTGADEAAALALGDDDRRARVLRQPIRVLGLP